MTAPKISVLMPVRNGAATLPAALSSTLRDLPETAELLVLDDASSDNTPYVLRGFSRDDRRVRPIRSDENIGVAAALNRMLAEASGELVARMDADDITLPGRFALQRRAIEEGADVVFAGRINFGRSLTACRPTRLHGINSHEVPYWLLLENPLTHSTMMGRRALIQEHGGYVSGVAEDYELWLRLAAAGAGIQRLALPGILYRRHASQVTQNPDYLQRFAADTNLAASHAQLAQTLGWDGAELFTTVYGERDDTARAQALAELELFLVLGSQREYMTPKQTARLLQRMERLR
jgi:glycosyltransferase involved in cell wall biosynthesis